MYVRQDGLGVVGGRAKPSKHNGAPRPHRKTQCTACRRLQPGQVVTVAPAPRGAVKVQAVDTVIHTCVSLFASTEHQH